LQGCNKHAGLLRVFPEPPLFTLPALKCGASTLCYGDEPRTEVRGI